VFCFRAHQCLKQIIGSMPDGIPANNPEAFANLQTTFNAC